jgi:hypothetical protein
MSVGVNLVNGWIRTTSAPLPAIYDQETTIGVGGLTAGTALTLPSSQTYTSSELEVYMSGQFLNVTDDYTYVGTAPHTQVTFTFNLVQGDVIRFRITRNF